MKHGAKLNNLSLDDVMHVVSISVECSKNSDYVMRHEEQQVMATASQLFDSPSDLIEAVEELGREMLAIQQGPLTVAEIDQRDIKEYLQPSELNGYSRCITLAKIGRVKSLMGEEPFNQWLRGRVVELGLLQTTPTHECEKCGKQTDRLFSKEVVVGVTEGQSTSFGGKHGSFRTSRYEHKKVMNVCKECAGGCMLLIGLIGLSVVGITAIALKIH